MGRGTSGQPAVCVPQSALTPCHSLSLEDTPGPPRRAAKVGSQGGAGSVPAPGLSVGDAGEGLEGRGGFAPPATGQENRTAPERGRLGQVGAGETGVRGSGRASRRVRGQAALPPKRLVSGQVWPQAPRSFFRMLGCPPPRG